MVTRGKEIDILKVKLAVSKSEEAFIQEYKKYDVTGARELHLQILNELENAIKDDNIEDLEILCKAVNYIHGTEKRAIIRNFYDSIHNPIKYTNFVILACKHNKIRILKHLFDNKSEVLNELIISIIGEKKILPNDEDGAGHNAFYYAIRSGNIELLDALIKWAGGFSNGHSAILNESLSNGYEELKLKNVPLTEEMEIFVERELINLRFFSNSNNQKQSVMDITQIKGRIEVLVQNITALNKEYSNVQVDEKFLYMTKFIVKNIYVLKHSLKFTYDRLPWEEIEFCLISFLHFHMKQEEINLFYAILEKGKILMYLKDFATQLEAVKDMIHTVNVEKLTILPKKFNREKYQATIIGRYPQFEELYANYRQIRDVCSLQKMYYHINLASFVFPKDNEGKLIILRVLTIISENLKNTLESPKLSTTISELLLHSLPLKTGKIINYLRNSSSDADSFFDRINIAADADENFYIGIQRDIKSVGEVIFEILFSCKIKMVRILLQRIVDSENLNEIKEIVKVLDNAKLDENNLEFFKVMDHEKLQRLVKNLSDNINRKTIFLEKLLSEIYSILGKEKHKSENLRRCTIVELLKSFKTLLIDNRDENNTVKRMKFIAYKILDYTTSNIDPKNLKQITNLSMKIFFSCSRRQSYNLEEMTKLMYMILYIAEFQTADTKWIKGLREKLNEVSSLRTKRKQDNISFKELDNQLMQRILKDILTNNSLIGQSLEELPFYKYDKNLQMAIEMLVLDLMSSLENSKSKLVNNLFYLEENAPSITGKLLLNHLAHDNALVDLLLSDPSTAIISNARNLAEGNNILESKQKNKLFCYNTVQLVNKYTEDLTKITIQDKLFCASREGNLNDFKDSIKYGADIKARNNNLWSALHFAAMGPNLEIVKFILNEHSDANLKDIIGQNPLHIAASTGRDVIVEYFLVEVGLNVDDVDDNGRTSLHIATQNGHKNTVEILLKNKANVAAQDICGLSPLHYAIINNHTNIAEILLNSDANADINEAMGGYIPLQMASEFGKVELLDLLFQNNADINVSNDNNYTPLHAAVLNDRFDIVNALILKGVNVKTRVIDGCTPLHYAVEKNNKEIVEMLLKHGGEVNTVDKTFLNAPIHYATHDGYTEIVKILISYNANISLATAKGLTPLHLAALGGHLEIANILINHRVNINSGDTKNNSPLHLAAEYGHEKIAELLLINGAQVNICSDNSLTPLYMAAMNGHEDVVNTLVKYKADVNARNSEGRTILHVAAVSGV